MILSTLSSKIKPFDERRELAQPGNREETLTFSAEHFITLAKKAIEEKGSFSVALSGGSTPKALFEKFLLSPYKESVDWSKFFLFWSDERSVPPENKDSNYSMAMKAAFSQLPIPQEQIFRMVAEKDIEENAKHYGAMIDDKIPSAAFDLVMLGIGEDGHTASLFPETEGLTEKEALVVANYVPKLDTWRLSLTYKSINAAKNIVIYALGKSKASIVPQILEGPFQPKLLPVQAVGTPKTKALWILDDEAAEKLKQ